MKQILIIEDDSALQQIYKESLEPEGYTVSTATTGKEGLELAKKLKLNLILLDIMLPGGMNGFDVMEQLKQDEELRTVPVIVLTNLDTEKKTAIEMGAADYIVKANTSIDAVITKVKTLLPQ